MRKAVILKADGEGVPVEIPDDTSEGLAACQQAVGGYIQRVPCFPRGAEVEDESFTMFANEEAKLSVNAKPNLAATRLSGYYPQDYIAGDVIILGPAKGSITTGLSERQVEQFLGLAEYTTA